MGLFGNNETKIRNEYASNLAHILLDITKEINEVRSKIEENNKDHLNLGKELNKICEKILGKIENKSDENSLFKLDKSDLKELMNLESKYLVHHQKVIENYNLVFDLTEKQSKRSEKAISDWKNIV
jgi:hypothetical protein